MSIALRRLAAMRRREADVLQELSMAARERAQAKQLVQEAGRLGGVAAERRAKSGADDS